MERAGFEGLGRRGSQRLRFLVWQNLEVFVLPHRDRDGSYASVPKSWRLMSRKKHLKWQVHWRGRTCRTRIVEVRVGADNGYKASGD